MRARQRESRSLDAELFPSEAAPCSTDKAACYSGSSLHRHVSLLPVQSTDPHVIHTHQTQTRSSFNIPVSQSHQELGSTINIHINPSFPIWFQVLMVWVLFCLSKSHQAFNLLLQPIGWAFWSFLFVYNVGKYEEFGSK